MKNLCYLLLFLSIYAQANEKSIRINENIANHMFIGAPENKMPWSKNTKNSAANSKKNHLSLDYQQLISTYNKKHLWFEHNKLNVSGLSLVSLLRDLGIPNLDLPELSITSVKGIELANTGSATENIKVETHLTATDFRLTQYFYYIATLFNGYQLQPKENPKADIIEAIKNQTLANYVDQLLPQFDEVVRLRLAIAHYRKLSKLPWPVLDKSLTLKLGQGHKSVVKIRRMLAALSDLKQSAYSPYRQHIFDPEVVIALQRFQTRHDLKPSGKLDPQTITALNTTPEQRMIIMQINLWRWLSLPSEPPQRYVLVNIPSYRLSLIDYGQETLAMRVIVGDKTHPTPIMITQVNSVTINPTWTPTYNIVHNELLPENDRSPGSLKRQNFQLAKGYGKQRTFEPVYNDSASIKTVLGEYRLVQSAGTNNALGKYRFNIKNFHSVYLHDTPAKKLFNKSYRALSHGCVRLQSASLLAQQFLNEEHLTQSRKLQSALQSNETTHIALTQSVPVYLTYQTVRVTASGKLFWQADIYQQDAKILSNIQTTQSDATVSNVMLAQQ
jgi:murein L,D-transpeptidase YcbB/YkuD